MVEQSRGSRLTIGHLNIGGQVGGIRELILGPLGAPDVAVFTETWLMVGAAPAPVVPGYIMYECRRQRTTRGTAGRPHGGIAVYLKNDHPAFAGARCRPHPSEGLLVVELQAVKLALFACYFSPEGASQYNRGQLHADPVVLMQHRVMAYQVKGLPAVIVGDLNARIGSLSENTGEFVDGMDGGMSVSVAAGVPLQRRSADTTVNQFGKELLDVLPACQMVVLNGRAPGDEHGASTCSAMCAAARLSGSVVDIMCVSGALYPYVASFKVLSGYQRSQHSPILLECGLPPLPAQGSGGGGQQGKVRVMRPPMKGEFAAKFTASMTCDSAMAFWGHLSSSLHQGDITATSAVDAMLRRLRGCLPRFKPGAAKDNSDEPSWWNQDLAKARHLWRQQQRQHEHGGTSLEAVLSARSSYRRQLNYAKRVWWRQQQVKWLEIYFSADQAAFWRALGTRHGEVPFTAEQATAHFTRILNDGVEPQQAGHPGGGQSAEHDSIRQQLWADLEQHAHNMPDINGALTEAEVASAIAALKPGKAADAQGVTAECMLLAFEEVQDPSGGDKPQKVFILAPLLTALFNRVLLHRDVPWQFTVNSLTPIYKGKGDVDSLDSYRGIAVGSILGKVFESVLYQRLNTAAEAAGLRAETQCGFREGMGTLDGMFVLRHLVDAAAVSKRPLYAVFVDFEKAFDTVDRPMMLTIWQKMGVSGACLHALEDMYSAIRMQVKAGGQLGAPFDTQQGTKQGSLLSPLLFGGVIERLHQMVKQRCPGLGPRMGSLSVPDVLYADDVGFYTESPDEMQQLLDMLDLFCTLFLMTVNTKKTYAVIFTPGKSEQQVLRLQAVCKWQYRGKAISFVEEFKYLGVVFHQTRGCVVGAKALAAPARRAMYAALSRLRALGINQPDFTCRMFDLLVRPIMSYGCQVWGPDLYQGCTLQAGAMLTPDRRDVPAEGVQLDFLRMMAGMPASAHIWTLFKEFSRQPVQLHWMALCARFWERSTKKDPGSLLREAMFANTQLFLNSHGGSTCWVARFLGAMCHLGIVTKPQVEACHTVEDVWGLDITEAAVRDAVRVFCDGVWQQPRVSEHDPAMAPSDAVTWCTYKQWVLGDAEHAPYLKAFIATKQRLALMRLRLGGFPLRVCTGRYEYVHGSQQQHKQSLPRAMRICKLCHPLAREGSTGCVEHVKHFLVDCPAYADIRARWPAVFSHTSPAAILNHGNQAELANIIWDMITHRHQQLQSPS